MNALSSNLSTLGPSAVRSTRCQYARTNSNKRGLVRSHPVYYSLRYSTTRPPRTCHEHAQVITKKLRPYKQNTLATSRIHAYCLSDTSGVVLTLGARSRYARTRRSSIFPNPDKLPRYQLRGLLFPPVTCFLNAFKTYMVGIAMRMRRIDGNFHIFDYLFIFFISEHRSILLVAHSF
jgi:hypothetical protein